MGREGAIEELTRLLGVSRLITLTGAGGSGKTRLAMEVARGVADRGGTRVVWVGLAPVSDPALLVGQVLGGFGIREEGAKDPAVIVAERIGDTPTLLFLDNCEHLVEPAAELVDALLRAAPALGVLATGREPLGVPGERAWLVPPLAFPDPTSNGGGCDTNTGTAESVRLFIERARDAVPDFQLDATNQAAVAEICRRLDGIPLAIELAAARVRVLAPEQIRDRLDDAFHLLTGGGRTVVPRHRTLRAAIDWSHDLLREEARVLLRRLSVFHGGFGLEAVEEVASRAPLERSAMLDLVGHLVDRSMVMVRESRGEARYDLLETVRQYARQRLDEANEAETLAAQHAGWMLRRAEEADPWLLTSHRQSRIEALRPELDNLRAALAWSRLHDPPLHVRLVGALRWFWYSSGHWREGRRISEEAIPLSAGADAAVRSRVLFAAGSLAALQGHGTIARPWLEESVQAARAAGDPSLEAYARNYLGMALIHAGEPAAGGEECEAAAEWYRSAGDLYGLRLALLLQGTVAMTRDETEGALAHTSEAVDVARVFGLDRELGIALQMDGFHALRAGRLDRAEAVLREAVAADRRDPGFVFGGRALKLLAVVASRRGRHLESARLTGAGAAMHDLVGAVTYPLDRPLVDEAERVSREALGDEAFERAREEGRSTPEAVRDGATKGGATSPASVLQGAPPQAGSIHEEPEKHEAHEEHEGRPAEAAPPAPSRPDLVVRALGPLEVEVEGRLLEPSAWAYAKPRELLLQLLLHPRGRTRGELAAALWPDAAPGQLKNSFHVTLHHLRKTLGHAEWVVIEGERYRLAPERTVAFDAARFEEEIRELLRAPRTDSSLPSRLQRTQSLYRGDFLEGESAGPWHLEQRDALRALHVEAAVLQAGLLEQEGREREAADLYRAIVAREDLHEEAHRGLMRTLARIGERPRALRVFEELAGLLQRELDAEPERETMELAERLRKGQRAAP